MPSFISLLSHLLSAWFAFLLPSYSTFKSLSHRPVSEPELERWCKYWCIIGAFVAFEYVGEWFISWFPFYFEVKTLFILFLALPQTEGSTYIYNNFLQPYFATHEADLDAGINAVQTNTFAFAQDRLQALWQLIFSLANKAPVSGNPPSSAPGAPPPQGQAPAFSLGSALGVWEKVGPSIMGALQGAKGAATSASPAQTPGSAPSPAPPTASASSLNPGSAERRSPYPTEQSPPFPEPQIH